MAFWDARDPYLVLLRRWLDAFRAAKSLADSYDKAWRPMDTENNVLAKLLRSYCQAYLISSDDQKNFRHGDSDLFLLRKILTAYRAGVPTLPDTSELAWRPQDSERDLLAKILRCLSLEKVNTDATKNFMPSDNAVWCVRKIVGLL
ncbi:MAG: hypothetical protein EBR82_21580 [Caulobacteraceae bacterium]|nr:hypothetical protein [Caulobacteraceae bacterium]